MSKQLFLGDLVSTRLPRLAYHGNAVISLSDSDIPASVEANEDAHGGFQILFHYPDDEISTASNIGANVVLLSGKYSGKITGAQFSKTPNRRAAIVLLSDILKERVPTLKKLNQRLNYLLISDILENKGDELITQGK